MSAACRGVGCASSANRQALRTVHTHNTSSQHRRVVQMVTLATERVQLVGRRELYGRLRSKSTHRQIAGRREPGRVAIHMLVSVKSTIP